MINYSIKGLILHSKKEFPPEIFSGVLRINETTKRIGGEFSDKWGISDIRGFLDLSKGILNFSKKYRNGDGYRYEYKKVGEIFRGYWNKKYSFGKFPEDTMCEVYNYKSEPLLDWEKESDSIANWNGVSYEELLEMLGHQYHKYL